MKTWTLFIIAFLKINAALACGYYPEGEDVRFSFINHHHFPFPSYAAFNYNAYSFGFEEQDANIKDENIASWFNYFQQRVDENSISTLLYNYSYSDLQNGDNEWLKYLRENNRTDVLKYLQFAKKCEDFNGTDVDYDPWERGSEVRNINRSALLKELVEACKSETNTYLQRRYAFLIIRLAYYDDNKTLIQEYFKKYFQEKDFLYYWALFFYCFTDEATSTDIANVLIHSPEKRYASYYYFRKRFKLDEALQNAKTNQEKANAYAFASVQKLDKSLDNLKAIYQYQPDAEVLGFLLLREVNKLEDWIYTPYYRNFNPSTTYAEETNTMVLRKRSERDRLYAKEVLKFVLSVDLNKVKNPQLWQTLKIHLQFMTRDFEDAIIAIDKLHNSPIDNSYKQLLDQIKALCIVSLNPKQLIFQHEFIKSVIQKNITNKPFLFALGRELEFHGNITDGIALISFINRPNSNDVNGDYYSRYNWDLLWQGNRNMKSGNLRYFFNYFEYVDFVYSAESLKEITTRLEQSFSSDFEKYIYSQLLTDKHYLLDLLGMKYIRENQLETALNLYKSMDPTYWQNNYNGWERDVYDEEYYAFDKNPFYDFKHTPSNILHKDEFIVTKISILERLIRYQSYANDPHNQDRAYYAFLVGNCYYNMSTFGHAWMMRRFTSSYYYSDTDESYIDQKEYSENILAQHYYNLGYQVATSPKMKALCLRMKIYAEEGWPTDFRELSKQYPEYYKELSSCSDWNKFIGR